MSYSVQVTFKRELTDDAACIGVEPELVTDDQLIEQLRKELQMGYDDCGMAGSFNIDQVIR